MADINSSGGEDNSESVAVDVNGNMEANGSINYDYYSDFWL